MIKYLGLLLLNSLPTLILSQTVTEKVIVTDDKDSTFINANGGYSFNENGDYCFEVRDTNKEYYAITKKGKIGPFISMSGSFSNSGGISLLYNSYDNGKEFYYKNYTGVEFYGPISGKIERQITKNSKGNVALTVSRNDTIFFYLDGQLVAQQPKNKNPYIVNYDWCTFSSNGKSLYYLPGEDYEVLYLNGIPIDTATGAFTALRIVDSGYYMYAKANRTKEKTESRYSFYIHTSDTIIGPVSTIGEHFLNDDGSYYCTDDEKGEGYIILNNVFYKNLEEIANITIPDKKNYSFTFRNTTKNLLNANGRIIDTEVPFISHLNMDNMGNFSYFILKNYFLFRSINGHLQTKPLSRYGVRAIPIFGSGKGNFVYYFQTDDSTYLYKNDDLILPPIAKNLKFSVYPWDKMLSTYPPKDRPRGRNQLAYFEYDSTGYFIFNGTLSRPMYKIKNKAIGRSNELGRIIMGDLNDNGFFVVQKTGEKEYTLNINNSVYQTFDGVDKFLYKDYFFNGKELIFYVVKNLSFFQIKITLQ